MTGSMHHAEGSSLGTTEEDMAPAMAAFAAYADDLSAAGVLIFSEVHDAVATTATGETRPVARTYAPGRGWYNP